MTDSTIDSDPSQPQELLDASNDYVFKRIFADDLDLLSELINQVRHDAPPIQVTDIINPDITPMESYSKQIVLDVLGKDADGVLYNIEMQVDKREPWESRSIYYMARTLTMQMKSAETYAQLKPVICIHWLDHLIFKESNQAIWCFEMRDRKPPLHRALGDGVEMHMIEMPKIDRALDTTPTRAMKDWITYFRHAREADKMQQVNTPSVQKAYQKLQTVSADEKDRANAMMRERFLLDERTQRYMAEQRGIQIGEQQGERKMAIAIARSLLHLFDSDEKIAEITQLDAHTVKQVRAGVI